MPRILIIFAILLTGCGYHFGVESLFEQRRTISIPFVEGDDKGYLTSALIKEIATRTHLKYSYFEGDLELKVAIIQRDSENIGFRYAPDDKTGGLTKIIVAEEGRLFLTALVTLTDCKNGCVLLGPFEVTQALTFDFEPDFTNVNFHAFSLGQLEMRPLAEEGALDSLDILLAKKIVDTIIYCK